MKDGVLVPSERTGGSGYRLKYTKFHLNVREEKVFYWVKHWEKLDREATETPS